MNKGELLVSEPMGRELAVRYIIMSRETKAHYNRPLFTEEDIVRLIGYFEATDLYLTTCNSLQKTPCYIEESKCMIFDTGITEFFAFLNGYIGQYLDEQLFEGILLRLFVEGFYLIDEYDFSALLLKGYHFYEDMLISGLNADSYQYLRIQELFVVAHELAHAKLGNDGFKSSDVFAREKESLVLFREVAENQIKVSPEWSEFYNENVNEPNFYEEFVCDSLAIRAIFSMLNINMDTIYTVASAIILAIYNQYIIAAVNSDVVYAQGCMTLINRSKDDFNNIKLEYPSKLHNFGTYLVYRYGYVRFCINTICQDFGISYEDMKTVDNHTFSIGERFGKLFKARQEGTIKILELFYDYKSSGGFAADEKEARQQLKEAFIGHARKHDDWLIEMSR